MTDSTIQHWVTKIADATDFEMLKIWVRDVVEGMVTLPDSHSAMYALNKVPHPWFVLGLSTWVVKNAEQMDAIMTRGNENRIVGKTKMYGGHNYACIDRVCSRLHTCVDVH